MEGPVFGVLHMTGKDPVIEPAESSGSHVKWSVSSLSPITAIFKNMWALLGGGGAVPYHGAVLVYKELSSGDRRLVLRVYVTLNTSPAHVEVRMAGNSKFSFCLLMIVISEVRQESGREREGERHAV